MSTFKWIRFFFFKANDPKDNNVCKNNNNKNEIVIIIKSTNLINMRKVKLRENSKLLTA